MKHATVTHITTHQIGKDKQSHQYEISVGRGARALLILHTDDHGNVTYCNHPHLLRTHRNALSVQPDYRNGRPHYTHAH